MQCHSLAVGHRKPCDENALQKKCAMYSQSVGHMKRCDETIKCHITHNLFVIGKDTMRLPFTKMCSDISYSLLMREKDVMTLMRLLLTKMCYSLTPYHWS